MQLGKESRQVKKDRKPIFCDICGRIVFKDDHQYEWWLDNNSIVRCPQHITEWSLRISGKKRTKESFKWMREAKEHDKDYDPKKEWLRPIFLMEDINVN